jgi:hypothetical protein
VQDPTGGETLEVVIGFAPAASTWASEMRAHAVSAIPAHTSANVALARFFIGFSCSAIDVTVP